MHAPRGHVLWLDFEQASDVVLGPRVLAETEMQAGSEVQTLAMHGGDLQHPAQHEQGRMGIATGIGDARAQEVRSRVLGALPSEAFEPLVGLIGMALADNARATAMITSGLSGAYVAACSKAASASSSLPSNKSSSP